MSKPTVINGRFTVQAVLVGCILIEIGLVMLDLIFNDGSPTHYLGVRRFCNIAREDSLASLFGTLQTLALGLTAWLVFWTVKRSDAHRRRVIGWFILAAFFTFMALDDGTEFHERLGSTFEIMQAVRAERGAAPAVSDQLLATYPSYPWQVLYGPPLAIMGIFIVCFLFKEFKSPLARVGIVAGLTCFAIAIGLDYIEGLDDGYSAFAEQRSIDLGALRHYSKVIEEFLEMLGITFFLGAVLSHFMKTAGTITLVFQDGKEN